MSDPLSVAASVAGLVGLTLQLIDVVSRFSGAAAALQEIIQELTALQVVLKQLDSFLDIQGPSGFSHTSALCIANAACECKLRDLLIKPQKSAQQTSKTAKLWDRLRWPLASKEHRETVDALHRYTQMYELALTVDGCQLLCKTSNEVSKSLRCQLKLLENTQKISLAMPELVAKADEATVMGKAVLEILSDLSDMKDNVEELKQGVDRLEIMVQG